MKTQKLIRKSLISWKHSVKQTQKQCYISGKQQDLEIHHAEHSFGDILRASHEALGLTYYPDTANYSKADLEALIDAVVEAHKDVVPVVLNKDIHAALHKQYGKHVNMKEIEEFKKQYIKNKKEKVVK